MKIKPISNTVTFGGVNRMGKEAIRFIPASVVSDLEKSIEKRMAILPTPTDIKKFANGETYINIRGDMRNKDVYLMPVTGKTVNDNLMETYLKADAARRMGANKVVAVMPNFPYGRQERKTELGEPISARLNLALLHASGVDEVITTDIHAAALQGFARQMKLTDLSSLEEMTAYFKGKVDPENLVVVSPDLGGVKRADKFAKALNCEKAIIFKNRAAHNVAKAESLLGSVEGKDCIIYDDIIDTAGTITEAAKMLKENGANRIFIAASHGLFNGPALERLEKAPIEEVVVTNSEFKPALDKIKQVDIAPKIIGTILDISG
jgi:ribose-phosphate pyrophosphokinase